jgi:uncharacterized protein (DUF2267 family)
MHQQDLVVLVNARAGLRKASEGRRALGAALGALGCALDDEDVLALSKALPGSFARVLGKRLTCVRNADEFYAEAERRERVGPGFVREHTQVALQVLAEQLDGELVTRLRKHLPPDLAALLRARQADPDAPPHVRIHPDARVAARQGLSRARPGAAEPIADAGHELAHARSVARSSAPHADRMVETARSTRPGREDDTLASARERANRR